MENNLCAYRKAFFDEAKLLNKWRTFVDIVMVVSALLSLFFNLYAIYIPIIAMQCLVIYLNNSAIRSRSIGLELARIEMIKKVGGIELNRKMSDVIGGASRRIVSRVNAIKNNREYYNSGELIDGDSVKRFRMMILENAYWNRYLYQKNAKKRLIFFAIIYLLLLAFLLFGIYSKLKNNNPLYDIIVIIISFAAIWRGFDECLRFSDASKKMHELDIDISSSQKIDEQSLMLWFSKYNIVLSNAGDIDNDVYQKYNKQLNDGWSCRLNAEST